jgi:hypothetical protein
MGEIRGAGARLLLLVIMAGGCKSLVPTSDVDQRIQKAFLSETLGALPLRVTLITVAAGYCSDRNEETAMLRRGCCQYANQAQYPSHHQRRQGSSQGHSDVYPFVKITVTIVNEPLKMTVRHGYHPNCQHSLDSYDLL